MIIHVKVKPNSSQEKIKSGKISKKKIIEIK